MKNRVLTMAAFLAVAVTGYAFAQSGASAVAKIPFAFHVGAKVLPAGEYTVIQNPSQALVQLRGEEDSMLILTNTCDEGRPQRESKLVFHRYGDHYFLSKVWIEGYAQGRELRRSAAEREMAKSAQPQAAKVILAER